MSTLSLVESQNEDELQEKIRKYLKISDKVPFDVFIDHLNLDTEFVINQLDDWGEKHKFLFIDNKIIKVKEEKSV